MLVAKFVVWQELSWLLKLNIICGSEVISVLFYSDFKSRKSILCCRTGFIVQKFICSGFYQNLVRLVKMQYSDNYYCNLVIPIKQVINQSRQDTVYINVKLFPGQMSLTYHIQKKNLGYIFVQLFQFSVSSFIKGYNSRSIHNRVTLTKECSFKRLHHKKI